jgi:hypothetical protein
LRSFLAEATSDRTGDALADALARLDRLLGKLPAHARLHNGNELGAIVQTDGDRAFTKLTAEVAEHVEALLLCVWHCPLPRSAHRAHRNGLTAAGPMRFAEIWTYSDATSLAQTFYPSVLGSATDGLGPVYDRLLDAGKLVNLADWSDALPPDWCGAKGKEAKRAAFVRGASELAWLGLIGPTKRKTEHVARLIW